jgi:wyosine [tRNA(Phe)-imidazoG37] synthetase (radical SAM superfamily)
MQYRYLFGPVISGRLGRSLGLDLLGGPVCSFDCLYCEAGATRRLTTLRASYVPVDSILDELRHWLAHAKQAADQAPEYITLGGTGEPCLNSGLGEIIAGAKALAPGIPVAVLTNSSLLTDPEVREELNQADAVLPSLDSLVEEEFRELNLPHQSLTAKDVAQGLLDFASGYSGRIYLEILLVQGKNDSAENLKRLKEYCRALQPDRVDVVTMTRPGTSPEASPVDRKTVALWRQELGAVALSPGVAKATQNTGRNAPTKQSPTDNVPENAPENATKDMEAAVRHSLRRRPQTTSQLAEGLSLSRELVENTLETLTKQGHIRTIEPKENSEKKETFFAIRK